MVLEEILHLRDRYQQASTDHGELQIITTKAPGLTRTDDIFPFNVELSLESSENPASSNTLEATTVSEDNERE